MSFASFLYCGFLLVVWGLHRTLPLRFHRVLLLAASYAFYAAWDWRFLGLIVFSTAVDFSVALRIEACTEAQRRRQWLLVSVTTNLGLLALFKYAGFFIDSFVDLATLLGLPAERPVLEIVLPVGISFYTFQTLGYTVDVYRGQQTAAREPLLFALYVAFFPQLVAGPIERASRLLPQLARLERAKAAQIYGGLELLLSGYFKKLVIADPAAEWVDRVFGDVDAHSSAAAGLAIYLFAFQIYADFSAYTDIARGTSRLFGVELTHNFSQPYLSTSPREFWRRWHISLSTWLRDYLYIPLGGSRRGRLRLHLSLIATMLLGGLWHGVHWRFVVWGLLHALMLSLQRALGGVLRRPADTARRAVWRLLGVLATFHVVCVAWVFFRAESVGDALELLRRVAALDGATGVPTALVATSALVAGCTLAMDVLCRLRQTDHALAAFRHPATRGAVYALMLTTLGLVGVNDVPAFIYFQF